jgi:hypothetical protein
MHHSKCLKCGVCHTQPKSQRRHRAIRTPAGAVPPVQECIRHEILHICYIRGPWACSCRSGVGWGGGASGQGNTSGPVRGHWLVKFVVGGVPLCYGINRAMRKQCLVADCLRCTLHVICAYTRQSSGLRNTETASTHQYVSYLNAFPRCDPSIPGRPCCRFQGESRLKLLRFLALSLFD